MYAAALTNPKGGFYAEFTAVKADNVSHVPEKLTTEQAGVMPSDAMTALRGLDDMLDLKQGEALMIFGASGGIGHLAVQLAKRMGARVLAIASGDDGVALATRLGADAVVNGRKDDVATAAREFAPDGLDAALVTAGGDTAERALAAVRDGGRVAYPNGVMPEPKARPGVRPQQLRCDPRPGGDRQAQPPDRLRPIRDPCRPDIPARPSRRGAPGAGHPLPRQARPAAALNIGSTRHRDEVRQSVQCPPNKIR